MVVNIEDFEFTDEQNLKIDELRNLVENCKSLKIGTEIEVLGRYLACSDWDVLKAFQHLNEYYDFKNKYPDWITHSESPDDLTEIIEINARILLPHTDKQGKFIIIHKNVDAFEKIPNYIMKLVQLDDLIYEAILSSPRGQKFGMTTIMDASGIGKNYLKYVTPSLASLIGKKCDAMPMRLEDKKAHFILKGIVANTLVAIILPFLGSLKKLAIFHKSPNFNKLIEYVGEEYLPLEYGGPERNVFDSTYLKEFLSSRYDYVKISQKYYKEK